MLRRLPLFLYRHVHRSMKSMHLNPLTFFLQQTTWPILTAAAAYFSYAPLYDGLRGALPFTGAMDFRTWLCSGMAVLALYLEYVNLGSHLAMDRDYGILEPVFISPVNRGLWLFGTVLGALPSVFLGFSAFMASSALFFGFALPSVGRLLTAFAVVFAFSLPWGALVCSIFLSGRNSRFLYALFETPAEFLSGARFPLSALPNALAFVASLYPLSLAIGVIRAAWSASFYAELPGLCLRLLAMALAYAALAWSILHRAEKRGKRDGTLSFG